MGEYELIIHGDRESGDNGHVIGHFFIELRGPTSSGDGIVSQFYGGYPTEDAESSRIYELFDNVYDNVEIRNDQERYEAARLEPGRLFSSAPIELTQEQYHNATHTIEEVRSGGSYILLGNNCVDFVQEIYIAAGQEGHFASEHFTNSELQSLGGGNKSGAGYYALLASEMHNYIAFGSEIIDSINIEINEFLDRFGGDTYIFKDRTHIIADADILFAPYPLTNLAAELGTTIEQLETLNPYPPFQSGTDGVQYLAYQPGRMLTLPDGTQMDVGELLLRAQFGGLGITAVGEVSETEVLGSGLIN